MVTLNLANIPLLVKNSKLGNGTFQEYCHLKPTQRRFFSGLLCKWNFLTLSLSSSRLVAATADVVVVIIRLYLFPRHLYAHLTFIWNLIRLNPHRLWFIFSPQFLARGQRNTNFLPSNFQLSLGITGTEEGRTYPMQPNIVKYSVKLITHRCQSSQLRQRSNINTKLRSCNEAHQFTILTIAHSHNNLMLWIHFTNVVASELWLKHKPLWECIYMNGARTNLPEIRAYCSSSSLSDSILSLALPFISFTSISVLPRPRPPSVRPSDQSTIWILIHRSSKHRLILVAGDEAKANERAVSEISLIPAREREVEREESWLARFVPWHLVRRSRCSWAWIKMS